MSRPTRSSAPSPTVKVSVRNRQRCRAVDSRWVGRLAEYVVVELLGLACAEIGVQLVDAARIARLNRRFLGHAGPTDVISFDYTGAWAAPARPAQPMSGRRLKAGRASPPGAVWGDLAICVEEAVAQARRFRTHWTAELARYLIHGLLHLMGYTDATPAARRRMKRQEDRLLRRAAREMPLRRLARVQPGYFTLRTTAQQSVGASRSSRPARSPTSRGLRIAKRGRLLT